MEMEGTESLTDPPVHVKESKAAKVLVRVVMSLLMIFAFLGIIWLGHPYLVAMVIIMQVACFHELVNVRYEPAREKQAPLFRTMQWAMFWVAMLHTYGRSFLSLGLVHSAISKLPERARGCILDFIQYRSFITLSGYVAIFVTFVCTLRRSIIRYQIGNLVWTAAVLCLIVLQVQGSIVLIFSGICWFVLPCGLVIANDCFAYIVGKSLGRRFTSATFFSISPNKTWEGFIGAFLCTVSFAWIFADILSRFPWLVCPQHNLSFRGSLECEPSRVFARQTIPIGLDSHTFFTIEAMPFQLHALVLAFFASFVAPFGGFLASGIKRAYDLKDFGDLIPGHGGVMDRLDCQLLMLLCAYTYHQTFVRYSDPAEVAEDYVMALLAEMPHESKLRINLRLAEMMSAI
eukprot:TRINITY_DN35859_c0_g1_i1.p1 TRINITY_DN35859_c0_g1~~TRINITY_DN35859_c0_g1_i1.p1  ORF type:complete len:428 (-),score=60.99 TRINITY_DN35859_c0_g1_i1:45-1250(-)